MVARVLVVLILLAAVDARATCQVARIDHSIDIDPRYDPAREDSFVLAYDAEDALLWSVEDVGGTIRAAVLRSEDASGPSPIVIASDDGQVRWLDCADGTVVTSVDVPALFGAGPWRRLVANFDSDVLDVVGVGDDDLRSVRASIDDIATGEVDAERDLRWTTPFDGHRAPGLVRSVLDLESEGDILRLDTARYVGDDGFTTFHVEHRTWRFDRSTGAIVDPVFLRDLTIDPDDPSGETVRALAQDGTVAWRRTFDAPVRIAAPATRRIDPWIGTAIVEGTSGGAPVFVTLDASGDVVESSPLAIPGSDADDLRLGDATAAPAPFARYEGCAPYQMVRDLDHHVGVSSASAARTAWYGLDLSNATLAFLRTFEGTLTVSQPPLTVLAGGAADGFAMLAGLDESTGCSLRADSFTFAGRSWWFPRLDPFVGIEHETGANDLRAITAAGIAVRFSANGWPVPLDALSRCVVDDPTGDGRFTAADAVTALRMVVGLEFATCAGDVDGDHDVEIDDAVAVLRRVVGLSRSAPAVARASHGSWIVTDVTGSNGVTEVTLRPEGDAPLGCDLTIEVNGSVHDVTVDASSTVHTVDEDRIRVAALDPRGDGTVVRLRGADLRASDVVVVRSTIVARDGSIATSAGDPTPSISSTRLISVRPNPFNPRTRISFSLARRGAVRVVVHDARGRRVRMLLDEFRSTGTWNVVWDGLDDDGLAVASGVYRVRLKSAEAVDTIPVALVR